MRMMGQMPDRQFGGAGVRGLVSGGEAGMQVISVQSRIQTGIRILAMPGITTIGLEPDLGHPCRAVPDRFLSAKLVNFAGNSRAEVRLPTNMAEQLNGNDSKHLQSNNGIDWAFDDFFWPQKGWQNPGAGNTRQCTRMERFCFVVPRRTFRRIWISVHWRCISGPWVFRWDGIWNLFRHIPGNPAAYHCEVARRRRRCNWSPR